VGDPPTLQITKGNGACQPLLSPPPEGFPGPGPGPGLGLSGFPPPRSGSLGFGDGSLGEGSFGEGSFGDGSLLIVVLLSFHI